MFVLGFDFGIKYFGVAVGQFLTFTASPLYSILIANLRFKKSYVFSIISFWKPKYIIIGYPISDIYNNSFILDRIDYFTYLLRCNFFCKIIFINENLSTWYARRTYILENKYFDDKFLTINALSAAILIEQWFSDNFVLY